MRNCSKKERTYHTKYILAFLLLGICFSLLVHQKVSACPAVNVMRDYTQPYGITFTGTLYGDEYLHYVVAEDGFSFLK
mgnify:FL=1